MNVQNCRQCGRIFNYVSGAHICPICKQEIEDKFEKVKEYLGENPNASIAAISLENDVTVNQLHQWIREERLIIAKNEANQITCQRCGSLVETGKYCQKCKDEMASAFKTEFNIGKNQNANNTQTKNEQQGSKMRFLDNKF